MMAVEQPLVAAFTARMPHPEHNLAAYGVVVSIIMLIDSPVIMLLTLGTAFSHGERSYARILRFSHLLIACFTIVHLLFVFTPLFDLIMQRVVGIPDEISQPSRSALLLMTPWTAAIGYRRLWQGVLIRYHKTKVVPIIIAVRLFVTTLILFIGFISRRFSGVHVAAVALCVGAVIAALLTYAYARPVIIKYLSYTSKDDNLLSWRGLVGFYVPLGMTTFIMSGARSILTAVLARFPDPLISLAIWPVVLNVLFLGRWVSVSFQEVVIALLKNNSSLYVLRQFTLRFAACIFAVFVFFAATPLSRIWFKHVAGLSACLVENALVPMAIMSIIPSINAFVSWQRGLVISFGHTTPITISVLLNVLVLGLVLIVMNSFLSVSGVVIASVALTTSVTAEWLYIGFHGIKTQEKLHYRFRGK